MNTQEKEIDASESLAQWAEKNPIKIYGDYRDELPNDMVDLLLNGEFDKFSESQFDIEMNMTCYESYSYEEGALKEACSELDLEYDSITDTERESFMESIHRDYSDFWDTCLRNSNARVAVTLLDDEGNEIYFPHFMLDESENQERLAIIQKIFGENITMEDALKMECTYDSEILKIGGTIDLRKLYEAQKLPEFIKIGPGDSDNLLCHESFNGSGSLGSFIPKKEAILKFRMRNDATHKYGIDAVYGFTSKYWNHELDFQWN